MKFRPEQVRQLRLRLGWSLAEFGRHMGGSGREVQQWESGELVIREEAVNRLVMLIALVDRNADRLVQQPVAEMVMERDDLAQITNDRLLMMKI